MLDLRILTPLCAALLANFVVAQQWTQAAPSTSPSARNSHGLAYDVARGVAVMFGGYDGNNTTALGDTWAYEGTNWTPHTPASAPDARWGHAMAFDNRRARTVLFGGFRPGVGSVADTWEFDGTNWTQLATANAPAGRAYHAMAFDSVRNRMVAFGGLGNAVATLGDTWTFDGVDWTQVATANAPSARRGAAIAFDAARGKTVLFGGGDGTTNFNDTWTFDGTSWTQRTTTAAPSARWQAAATFDSVRGRVLLHGGADVAFATNYGDTWEWDDTNWAQTSTGGPSARHGAGLVYDARRGAAVMFGGRGTAFGADTWEASSTPNAAGHAIRLNGIDAYGSASGVGGLVGNSTWEAWVRIPDYTAGSTGFRNVLFRWGMYSHSSPIINSSTGAAGAGGASCPNGAESAGGRLQPGTWHHVAAQYAPQPGPITVYVDGSLVASNSVGVTCGPYAGWTTLLGASGYTSISGFLRADIDEARISNTVRYSGPFNPERRFTPDANTVGLWHFDDASGSVALDSSGYNRHFTLYGGYSWVPGHPENNTPTPTATFTTYGTSCNTTFGAPQLTTAPSSTPRLGQTLQLRLSNLPTNSSQLPFGFFATRNDAAIGLPLPFSMARYGMNADCLQYVDPDSGLVFTLVNNAGSADWDLAIPNDPALLQLAVYFQGLVLDWNLTTPLPAASTNAGVATIGR